MREIKFKLVKDGQVQGAVELKTGGIIDTAYAWDAAYQFTGLYDKNYNGIYEGDILKIENPKCQYQKAVLIGTVVFQHASFGVDIKQISQWEGYSEFASKPNVVWQLNIIGHKEFKVIGNIYENPELMEAK